MSGTARPPGPDDLAAFAQPRHDRLMNDLPKPRLIHF
jgi:hypothetical protein